MTLHTPSPLSPIQLVDEYFIENRNRLLELAAFLDRVDRSGGPAAWDDFRMQAFREALDAVAGQEPDRLLRVQMILSDPSTEPLAELDRKGAVGAWNGPRTDGQ